jgi:hypothetical protein
MSQDFTGNVKEIISSAKCTAISRQVSAYSLLGVSIGICRRALVDESGMIKRRAGRTIHQRMVAVHGKLCTKPHRNSNQ